MPEKKPIGHTEDLINRYYTHLQEDERSVHARFPRPGSFDQDGLYDRIRTRMIPAIILRRTRKKWYAAAAVIVLIVLAFLGFNQRSPLNGLLGGSNLVEKSTMNGEIAQLQLSDGTKIWLNAGSTLAYPKTFNGERREVTLKGEAYFEVATDRQKPFIIYCGKLTTTVVGTSFNIKAYEEARDITVAVVSGEVKVLEKDKQDQSLSLSPNQIAIYDKENNVLVRQETSSSVLAAWKEGKMTYKSSPLKDIVADVERKYNVSIHADSNLVDCSVSVDFNDASLEKVLKVLAELTSGTVVRKEDTYYLKGKGCL